MRNLLLIILCVFSLNTQALQSDKQDNLDALLDVMDMDKMVDNMWVQMESMFDGTAKQYGITQDEQALFLEFRKKLTNVMRKELSWEKMRPDMKEIYRQNFTDQEIAELLAFYKTPTGQSLLQKMPAIMQQSMQLGQSMAQQAMPEIQAVSVQFAEELKAFRAENTAQE